jgi:short-subunit dehydrogenase
MNIIITGASSGIGYATVLALAAEPRNYILAVARSEDKLQQLAQEAQQLHHNHNVLPIALDLTQKDFLPLLKQVEKLGNEIDVLVNNAGGLVNKPFGELQDEDWIEMFQTNVLSAVHTTKLLLPYMGKNRRGHVVNIGSMGGYQGSSKFAGLAAYSASKAALGNLTECLAAEYPDLNVAFNCLALGAVQTEMLEKAFPNYHAPVTCQEMAQYIAFFCVHGQQFQNGKIVPLSITTP